MKTAAACIAAAVLIVVGLLYLTGRPPPAEIAVIALCSVVFFAGLPVVLGNRRVGPSSDRCPSEKIVVRPPPRGASSDGPADGSMQSE